MRYMLPVLSCLAVLVGCTALPPPSDNNLDPQLVERGREIFFNETFNGNGRTCGTCHPAENNLTIDRLFIAQLDDSNPLFVAEFVPALSENFENNRLLRDFGLILENVDGFDELDSNFALRCVPHLLGVGTTVDSRNGPRLGWGGDGSPGDGTLRSFCIGAIIQHFPKTLNRVEGVDFRLPTPEELDALEAFQLSLGRNREYRLPLPLTDPRARTGQALFNSPTTGKCFACHFNGGANAAPAVFGANAGNLNFDIGIERMVDQPGDITAELMPPDDGFGTPGDGTFSTPSLIEAADTPPFFHNNSVATIEETVAFYTTDAFERSPAGQLVVDATGSGIELDATQIGHVAAFLRVLNTLENIRQNVELIDPVALNRRSIRHNRRKARRQLTIALANTNDCIGVLMAGGLHPMAIANLRRSRLYLKGAIDDRRRVRRVYAAKALEHIRAARGDMVQRRRKQPNARVGI